MGGGSSPPFVQAPKGVGAAGTGDTMSELWGHFRVEEGRDGPEKLG